MTFAVGLNQTQANQWQGYINQNKKAEKAKSEEKTNNTEVNGQETNDQSTVNQAGELTAVQKTQQSQENTNSTQSSMGKGSAPATSGGTQYDANLKSALNSLGLTESDDQDADYARAMSHFSQLLNNAGKDISQKQYISSLKQAFISVYNAAA